MKPNKLELQCNTTEGLNLISTLRVACKGISERRILNLEITSEMIV